MFLYVCKLPVTIIFIFLIEILGYFLEILIQHTASGCGITPQYSDQRCYFEILRNLTIVGYVSIQLYELILGHTKIAVLVTIKRNKSVTEENIHFLKLLPSIRHR